MCVVGVKAMKLEATKTGITYGPIALDTLEVIARKVCSRRNLDPDERVIAKNTDCHSVCRYTEQWRIVANEVKQYTDIMFVIDEVKNNV
jgi:hypothetical protein